MISKGGDAVFQRFVVGMGIAVFMFIAGVTYFYFNKGEAIATEAAHSKKPAAEEETAAKAVIQESFRQKTPERKLSAYKSMSEEALVQEVHNMTHQKVAANEKWGASEITKEKVDALYSAISNQTFADTELQDMLLSILKPWKKGDFSNAVKAHNEIWAYQKGNIGKAERRLTPSEEAAYIKENFK